MSFNEKLQYLRKENKLSQEQLADMLDVTRQSVSKWESGTTYPEMDKLIMLCKIFKCSLDDLTNDEITEINVDKKEGTNSNNFINNILEIINKTVHMFKSMNFKQVIGCIVSLILLALVLLIFKLPFELIKDGISQVINPIVTSVRGQRIIFGIFSFILDIIYYALYILVYVYIYKIAYLDKYEFIEEPKITKNSEQTEKEIIEETKEIKIINQSNPKDNTIFKLLGGLALEFIKCLLIIFSLPVLLFLIILCFFLVICLYFIFEGIFFPGILLGLLFIILLAVWFIILVSLFIFNRKISFKKMLITFLVGIFGIGISAGLIAVEVSSFEYKQGLPAELEKTTENFEKNMTEDLKVDLHDYYHYYSNIKYIEDESVNNVKISIAYYNKIYSFDLIDSTPNTISFTTYQQNGYDQIKTFFTYFKKSLTERIVYDYEDILYYDITITSNSDNIKKIKENTKKYEKEREEKEERIQRENDEYTLTITNYEKEIDRLTEQNERLQEKIDELENFKEKVQNFMDE